MWKSRLICGHLSDSNSKLSGFPCVGFSVESRPVSDSPECGGGLAQHVTLPLLQVFRMACLSSMLVPYKPTHATLFSTIEKAVHSWMQIMRDFNAFSRNIVTDDDCTMAQPHTSATALHQRRAIADRLHSDACLGLQAWSKTRAYLALIPI
jgi:hypothetical protein